MSWIFTLPSESAPFPKRSVRNRRVWKRYCFTVAGLRPRCSARYKREAGLWVAKGTYLGWDDERLNRPALAQLPQQRQQSRAICRLLAISARSITKELLDSPFAEVSISLFIS